MAKRATRARRRRNGLLVGGALAGAVGAPGLLAAPARALDASYGGGVFVGYRFGASGASSGGGAGTGSHTGFEWGLEAFATHRFAGTGCSTEERTGVGPLLQVAILGLREPRVTLAAQGGGELVRSGLALSGELGLSYRFGPDGGLGIHTGILPETIYLNAGLSYEWLLQQGSINGGLRVQPTYGEPMMCVVGRPLRTDHGVLALAAAPASDASERSGGTRLGRDAVEPVGHAFARDAQNELSSVPAFLQLAAELAHAGAPASLVQRALHAARDEQLHTVLCARIARRHLGAPVALALPAIAARATLSARASVLRLARESWLDGCLAEGSAAAHAAAAAERTHDPEARAALGRIAADEQRHAELAWAILAWALHAGGEEARAAVVAASEPQAAAISRELAPEGLEAHGRLGAGALNAVAQGHLAASAARLARWLA